MKVLIAAGGTGGHIFPALAFAEKVKERNPQAGIYFCIDKRVNTTLLDSYNYKYSVNDVPQMPYGVSVEWFCFLKKLAAAFPAADEILTSINPDVVVGFGAYISGPILLQAKKRNKRIIIHEQNVEMGRANWILSKKADMIALGFDSKMYKTNNNTVFIGNPIRKELLRDLRDFTKEQALDILGLDNKKTILVMGGSLGSHKINSSFINCLKGFKEKKQQQIQIIHLTGRSEFDIVKSAYSAMHIKNIIYSFYERIGILYKACDFAVSRAGALTLSEFCIFNIPSILIPYAKAGAHQKHNAEFLMQNEAAAAIDEKGLAKGLLAEAVLSFLSDDKKLSRMRQNAKSLAQENAAERLADLVLES